MVGGAVAKVFGDRASQFRIIDVVEDDDVSVLFFLFDGTPQHYVDSADLIHAFHELCLVILDLPDDDFNCVSRKLPSNFILLCDRQSHVRVAFDLESQIVDTAFRYLMGEFDFEVLHMLFVLPSALGGFEFEFFQRGFDLLDFELFRNAESPYFIDFPLVFAIFYAMLAIVLNFLGFVGFPCFLHLLVLVMLEFD
jgi:hypothetical protein